MIKKIVILALVISLFPILSLASAVQAQSGLRVTANSAAIDFPASLRFHLSARGDANITDIRLHYSVDMASFARVTSEVIVGFVPGTNVETDWTWDMRQTGGLPPGTDVEYWWTVTDARGNKAVTDRAKVAFNDGRHTWQNMTENKVTMFWYEGRLSDVQEIMSAAQQALARLLKDTGAMLEKPVKIYLYPSTADLQGAMIFPQEWTGGVTFTGFGIIAIGLQRSNPDWNKRAIAHELTHLVINQVIFNPYNELPTWLDEGLAMYNEGPLETTFANQLRKAVTGNSLISVRSLSSPFSAYSDLATQSYAESQSLVEFLIQNYGQSKMFELLNAFREGNSYDGALMKVYGFDMDGLNTLWRVYITKKYQPVGAAVISIPHMIAAFIDSIRKVRFSPNPAASGWVSRGCW